MPIPCSAESATGSPSPSSQASISPASAARPSALLATRITRGARLRSSSASVRSTGVTPARASIMNRQTSAASIARSVSARIRPGRLASVASSRPAVSIDGEAQRPEPPAALAQVARHPGLVVDQRQPPPDEAVEERRLADVRPADDGDGEGHGAQAFRVPPGRRGRARPPLSRSPGYWKARSWPSRVVTYSTPPATAGAAAAPPGSAMLASRLPSTGLKAAEPAVGARHPQPAAGEDRPVVGHRPPRLALPPQEVARREELGQLPRPDDLAGLGVDADQRAHVRDEEDARCRPARPARRSPRRSSRRARRSGCRARIVRPALVRGIDDVADDHRVAADVVDAVARQRPPPAGDRRAPDRHAVAAEHAEELARRERHDDERSVGRRARAAHQPGAAGALRRPQRLAAARVQRDRDVVALHRDDAPVVDQRRRLDRRRRACASRSSRRCAGRGRRPRRSRS